MTPAQRASYESDGYCIIDAVLDARLINDTCQELSRLVGEADHDGRHPSGTWMQFEADAGIVDQPELQIRKFGDFALYDHYFWQLQQQSAWQDAIGAVCGPSARLLQSMGMVKPPGIGTPKDWHQDAPYFAGLVDRADSCCGIWIALDQATRANGCMEVVPGSHRRGIAAHIAGPTGWMYDQAETARCRSRAVAIELPPGSALLFHSCLDHFTDHNRSQHRRRALQYHYAPSDSRWIGPADDPRAVFPPITLTEAPCAREAV